MDLSPYVESLGRELLTVAETGGGDTTALIERLTVSMESAIRLTLLEALSAAADEITNDLAPGSVQVRLQGRDPNFVVTPAPVPQPIDDMPARAAVSADQAVAGFEDGSAVRINVRLPEQLKAAIEEAAGKEGRSLNAWLVRVASIALQTPDRDHVTDRYSARRSQHYTGWAQ